MKTRLFILALALSTTALLGQSIAPDVCKGLELRDIEPDYSGTQEYKATFRIVQISPTGAWQPRYMAADATFYATPDMLGWKDVVIGAVDDMYGAEIKGVPVPQFDRFVYKPQFNAAVDFLRDDFYANIPREYKDWGLFFVMDEVHMIEQAWGIADSLRFREEYYPPWMDNSDVDYDNFSFQSSRLKFVWSGITEHNGETCALVEYYSLYNPMVTKSEDGAKAYARSLYWGEFWISLEDKQVEYSKMIEDVFHFGGEPMNMQRVIVFDKSN